MDSTDHTMNYIVGATYFILPLLILPVYLILLYIFFVDEEFSKTTSYKLFLNLGFFECVQLLIHSTAGILTIFPEICEILGATINSTWVALFPATATIAVQRLLIIHRRFKSSKTFPWLLKVLLIVNWTYFIAFYVTLLTFATVSYTVDLYSWNYDSDSVSTTVSAIEYFVSIPTIIVTFIIYIIVVVEIISLRQRVTTISQKARQERSILLQSFIVFLNLTLLITAWHQIHLVITPTKSVYFVINCYWILYCGINPLLYLTMNRTIQKKFISFVRGRGLDSSQSSTLFSTVGGQNVLVTTQRTSRKQNNRSSETF